MSKNTTEPNQSTPPNNEASFGFKTVHEDQKSSLVQGVFESVAGNYDLMNDLMSVGIHRLWKKALINRIAPSTDMSLLDVAGGTGDISFRFLQAGGGKSTVCDITEGMVRVGRDRAIDQAVLSGVDWSVGDAEKLPFPDRSFDIYTIAFGLRNVTHIDRALAEARRVLKPGGRFFCLEFSHVVLPLFDRVYDTYSFSILPWLGEVVAKDRASYIYLAESIRRFPKQDKLITMMNEAGLEQNSYRNLSGGIAAIHEGWRI